LTFWCRTRGVSFQSAEQPLLGQFSVSGNTLDLLVLSNNGVVFLTAELEREAELLSDHFIRWLIYAGMFATGTERQRRWYDLCVLTRQGSANGSFV